MSAPLSRDLSASTADSYDMNASYSSSSMTMSMSMSTSPSSVTPSTPDLNEKKMSEMEEETADEHTPQALSRVSPPEETETDIDEDDEEQEERPLKRVGACLSLVDLRADEGESEMKGKRNDACANLDGLRRAAEQDDRKRQMEIESVVFVSTRRVGRTMKRAISVDTANLKPSASAGGTPSEVDMICFTTRTSAKLRYGVKRWGVTHSSAASASASEGIKAPMMACIASAPA